MLRILSRAATRFIRVRDLTCAHCSISRSQLHGQLVSLRGALQHDITIVHKLSAWPFFNFQIRGVNNGSIL